MSYSVDFGRNLTVPFLKPAMQIKTTRSGALRLYIYSEKAIAAGSVNIHPRHKAYENRFFGTRINDDTFNGFFPEGIDTPFRGGQSSVVFKLSYKRKSKLDSVHSYKLEYQGQTRVKKARVDYLETPASLRWAAEGEKRLTIGSNDGTWNVGEKEGQERQYRTNVLR